MRRWCYGSLGGHVAVFVLAGVMSTVFQQTPAPAAEFMTVDLAQLEIPRPEVVAPPEPIPDPPKEVEIPKPEPEPEKLADLPEPELVRDLVPPSPELPPEPEIKPEPKQPKVEKPVDLPEPEEIQRRETPPPAAAESPAEALDEGTSMRMRAPEGMVDYYYATLRRKIARQWRPDRASARGRRDVETIIAFSIGRAGEILGADILQSSGFSVFDRQCLRAVMAANPLPKPPSSYLRAGSVPIELIFGYNQ